MAHLETASQLDDEKIEAQHAQGRLTARERIELLCDEGSFQELPGDMSVVMGSGSVHGRRIFVFAKDHTVFSGSLSVAHAEKIATLQKQALAARAPLIGFFDSGGIRMEDGVAALSAYGEIVRNHVEAAGIIPQIAVVMGPCIGGDAFAAKLMDFIFMVSETTHFALPDPKSPIG